MDTSNIVRVVEDFGSYVLTTPVTRCDVGIKLLIDDIELPEYYQIDFSNSDKKGQSTTQLGDSTGVEIPVQYIQTGKAIYAFYYYVEDGYGKTVRIYHIPNKYRPDRENEVPTSQQQSVINQTISTLNTAVERAEAAKEMLENVSAAAFSLPEGADPIARYSNGLFTFGIPAGGGEGGSGGGGEYVGLAVVNGQLCVSYDG